MPNIGFPELIVILVIVLLLFGPKKLPDFARSMGQAIREFRKASQEVVDDIRKAAEEPPQSLPADRDAEGETRAVAQSEQPGHAPSEAPYKQL